MELWEQSYKEDYKRRGFTFEEPKKVTAKQNAEAVEMYKDLF